MSETLYDQAMTLYQRQDYIKLRAFKKAKKKSWASLGINAEMEARIMRDDVIGTEPFKVEGTITGRLPKTSKPQPQRSLELDLKGYESLKYTPREIHALKGVASHFAMALVSAIREQEKFRADPRFPLFLIAQRIKRYKDIFAGRPYLPIFS